MTTQTLIKFPRLHDSQRMVAEHPARFRVLAAGRRWGKSRLGSALCVAEGLQGRRAWWVAPTYKVANVGWRMIRRLGSQVPGAVVYRADRTVTFPGGGEVVVRSADNPDSLRGEGLDFVVLDECAFMLEESWTEALRPALSDRRGRAMFISTPSGRNWFWRLWQRGLEGGEWHSWQLPTGDNPYIDPDEIEAARAMLPEATFRQEYLAEFIEGAGLVFRNIRACLAAPPAGPAPGGVYVMGVDWAQTRDFTALVVMDVRTRQVVAIDRFNQIGWDVQRGRLAALAQQWNVAAILAEQNSIGGPNVEALQREGLPIYAFQTTSQSKQNVITALQLAFERGEIHIPDDPVLISELEAYEATRLPSGRWRYEAPAGVHDDTVIALALANEAANLMAAGPSQGLVIYDDPVNISPY